MSYVGGLGRLKSVFEGDRNWLFCLILVPLAVQLLEVWRLVSGYDRPPMTPDAGIFQQIGWLLTQGGRLYVDAWEPKFPLPFETTALLASLAGDDMYLYHVLNVLLMVGAAVGCVVLVGLLTRRVTGDRYASTVAAFSMFLLPGFVVRPAYGFKAKYALLFTGLLAIYLCIEDRPVASGAAAAASVGYWQLGAIFPLVVVGLGVQRGDRRTVAGIVGGGVAFSAAMFAPVVLVWESVPQMVAQAILIPALVGGEAPLVEKLLAGAAHFKWASPFVLVGVYGIVSRLRNGWGYRDWWIPACALWFGLVVLFIDFDTGGYTDLIPGLAFVAIGIGLFTNALSTENRRLGLGAAVCIVLIVNTLAFGAVGLVFLPADTPAPESMADLRTNERATALDNVPDDTPDVRYLYWQRDTPETCHYRLSLNEVRWLELAGENLSPDCSDLREVRAVRRSERPA